MRSTIATGQPWTAIWGRRSGDGGGNKGGSEGTGIGDDVQGGGSEVASLQKRELKSVGDNSEVDGGVPTLGGPDDRKYVR